MISTKKAVKCDARDGDGKKIPCDREARVLSMFDKFLSQSKKGLVKYERSTKYRCDFGHLTIVKDKIDSDDLKPLDVTDESELSKKRFHRKGFFGHKGQTPRSRKLDIPRWLSNMAVEWQQPNPKFPPDLPNHDRMLIRRERRSMMRPKNLQ